MKIQRHSRQEQIHRQSQELRLLMDLSSGLEKIFYKTGRDFLSAKSDAEIAAVKTKALGSINQILLFWRRTKGLEAVTRALNALSLSEYDT